MFKIELSNDLHQTRARVRPMPVPGPRNGRYFISAAVAKRLSRQLCGIRACDCSDPFGARTGGKPGDPRVTVLYQTREGDYVVEIREGG
jgi:hypothetical protein